MNKAATTTTTSTKTITKARKGRKPSKEINAKVEAATSQVKSLDELKVKGARRSIGAAITAEQGKLVKSAEAVIVSYCAIGDQLTLAKAMIEERGQSWKKFMEAKPLGIAYSTAHRYITAAGFGADKMLENFRAQGAGTLNIKALLTETSDAENAAQGKKAHGNRGSSPKTPSAASQSLSDTSGDLGNTPITDIRVENIMEIDVPRMNEAQAERLALALRIHLESLHEAAAVIEGEIA